MDYIFSKPNSLKLLVITFHITVVYEKITF